MINPYSDVNFSTCYRIPSFTHAHVTSQTELNKVTNIAKINFCPVSNYYPSTPMNPNDYTYPDDVIIAPNAEHHNFTINGSVTNYVHLNSLGSTFSSGSAQGSGGTMGYGGGRWQDFMTEALADLKYSDAGGITINHPSWSRLYTTFTDEDIVQMLDYDARVIGIEIYNGTSDRSYNAGYDLTSWDNILKTGRQCWGFSTPDWDISQYAFDDSQRGRCILLVSEYTEHECLKAYRNGNFYGQVEYTDLAFDSISANASSMTVSAANATYIAFVVDGVRTVYNNVTSKTMFVPPNATYIRAEAGNDEDRIFTNPIIYRPGKRPLKQQKVDFLLWD